MAEPAAGKQSDRSTSAPVIYEARDGVSWITLNRPSVLNALDTALAAALAECVERAAGDAATFVVVVRGAGRAFCSGMDRTALAAGAADRARARQGALAAQRRRLRRGGARHRSRHARVRAVRGGRGAGRSPRAAAPPGADGQRPHQAAAPGVVPRRSARARGGRAARAGRLHALVGDGRGQPRVEGEARARVPSATGTVTSDVILETEGLTKEFRGFVAVRNVGLRVRRGSIHALIGPNGAGKTTCFNLLTHFLTPTAGRIRFNGRDITGSKPAAIARMGLVRSFQISAVFPHLSVLENVRIALQRRRGASFDFWRSERVLDALNGRAVELIDAVGLAEFVTTPAVELPYGRKRALEIATTLALDP